MVNNKTKQNLMDAFWNLYETTRIEKITVKDICTTAGYNRSTFYQYFRDVFDVLDEIENALLPNVDELPQVMIGDKNIGMEHLQHLQYFKAKKKYLKVLLSQNGNPAFVHKLKAKLKPSISLLLEDTEHIENIDYALEYILSGMIGVMSYHIQNDVPIDDLEVIQLIKKLSSGLPPYSQ